MPNHSHNDARNTQNKMKQKDIEMEMWLSLFCVSGRRGYLWRKGKKDLNKIYSSFLL